MAAWLKENEVGGERLTLVLLSRHRRQNIHKKGFKTIACNHRVLGTDLNDLTISWHCPRFVSRHVENRTATFRVMSRNVATRTVGAAADCATVLPVAVAVALDEA